MGDLGRPICSCACSGKNGDLPIRPSPVLDKSRARMGPEIFPSAGAGVWRKAIEAFPDSSSVQHNFRSARDCPGSARDNQRA